MSAPLPSPVQTKNQLLAAFAGEEYHRLLPHLERIKLSLNKIIYQAETEILYVYFPESAVISLLSTLESGATTEVGLIGHEGMVGLPVFLGAKISHYQAVVQIAGTALRMKTSVLREEVRAGSLLHRLLLGYTGAFINLSSQTVACSLNHSINQRLARWLLLMHDYVAGNQLRLTQDAMAALLGSRRAGISRAASNLQKAGLIKYARGVITIRDRGGLEARSCECYQIFNSRFSNR